MEVVGEDSTEVRTRSNPERDTSGDLEAQIFDRLNWILENTNFFDDKDFIVLDIHTNYRMCLDCFKDAKALLKKFISRDKKLRIIVSYSSNFGKTKLREIEHEKSKTMVLVQKKIELLFLNINNPHLSLVKKLESKLKGLDLNNTFDLDPELIENIVPSASGRDSGHFGYKRYVDQARLQILLKNKSNEPSGSCSVAENQVPAKKRNNFFGGEISASIRRKFMPPPKRFYRGGYVRKKYTCQKI